MDTGGLPHPVSPVKGFWWGAIHQHQWHILVIHPYSFGSLSASPSIFQPKSDLDCYLPVMDCISVDMPTCADILEPMHIPYRL